MGQGEQGDVRPECATSRLQHGGKLLRKQMIQAHTNSHTHSHVLTLTPPPHHTHSHPPLPLTYSHIAHTHTHVHTQMHKLGLGEEVKELGEEELEELDKKAVEYEITVMEERLKQMTPNMAAIEEYRRKVCVWTGKGKRRGGGGGGGGAIP